MANQTSLTDERSPLLHTFRTVTGDSFNRISELLKSETDLSSDVVDDAILPEILSELALNSVDDLPSTLHNLHETQKRLQSQLENLAAEHYPVFLAKADASHSALKNLSNIVSANNALISRLPDLSDCAQAFLSKARILNDAIKINSKALDRHAQLLELLELPQLMETSIQNGHFDDAIAILAYAKRLAKKRGSTIPIIKIISSQVNAVGSQLIHQLCNQLRSPLSLPSCIKVVVFLRRTGVFTEQELRLKFLQARTTCLIDQLASGLTAPRISEVGRKEIDDHKTGGFRNPNRARYEAYWKATRRVEITRVQLFDIVTQYRTVFSEREHTTKFQPPDLRAADWTFLNGNMTTLSTNPLCLTADLQGDDPSCFNTNLLHAWLIHRIGVFLDTFAADLQQMLHQSSFTIQEVVDRWSSMGPSGSSADTTFESDLDMEALFTNLQSLISQSMYFGRSFSRIGCDFRPHLVDLFYSAISSYVKVFLNNATDEFSIALDNLLWKVTNAFLDDSNDMLNDEVINDHANWTRRPHFHRLRTCCPIHP
ncbi:hypothetical protein AHF37_00427 [Paragonimus kellicotti]|nr:hypothetical protein AHF37_00427 [Paragonimus kellicotti]